jgi:hypothetical protein
MALARQSNALERLFEISRNQGESSGQSRAISVTLSKQGRVMLMKPPIIEVKGGNISVLIYPGAIRGYSIVKEGAIIQQFAATIIKIDGGLIRRQLFSKIYDEAIAQRMT